MTFPKYLLETLCTDVEFPSCAEVAPRSVFREAVRQPSMLSIFAAEVRVAGAGIGGLIHLSSYFAVTSRYTMPFYNKH